MNNKIIEFIRDDGFCCEWAWLEAHRHINTSVLEKELQGTLKLRALQRWRAMHRANLTSCPGQSNCLKAQVRASIQARKTS